MSTQKSVLIVDDEPDICLFIKAVLEEHGYQCETCSDPQKVLDLLTSSQFDIMTLDIMMPKLDGFNLLKQIRKQDQFAKLPIIMISSKSEDYDIQLAEIHGATSFLTKPINAQELVDKIRNALAD